MKFQLWSTDEYGQSTIVGSGEDLEKLVKFGKTEVSKENVDNALTVDDKKRNWELCFPVVVGQDGKELAGVFYGGKNSQGKHIALIGKGDNYEVQSLNDALASVSGSVRFYLGKLDGQEWVVTDEKKKIVSLFTHKDILGKTVLFIKKI